MLSIHFYNVSVQVQNVMYRYIACHMKHTKKNTCNNCTINNNIYVLYFN